MGNKSGKAKKKDQKEEEDTSKVNGEAGQTEDKPEDTKEEEEAKPEVS